MVRHPVSRLCFLGKQVPERTGGRRIGPRSSRRCEGCRDPFCCQAHVLALFKMVNGRCHGRRFGRVAGLWKSGFALRRGPHLRQMLDNGLAPRGAPGQLRSAKLSTRGSSLPNGGRADACRTCRRRCASCRLDRSPQAVWPGPRRAPSGHRPARAGPGIGLSIAQAASPSSARRAVLRSLRLDVAAAPWRGT